MRDPVQSGRELLADIESRACPAPHLWWLGHAGFVLKFKKAILYIDPCLSPSEDRLHPPVIDPKEIGHAGLVLSTHAHARHLDPGTVPAILARSRRAKVVIPKSAAEQAHRIGIGYERMVTTTSDLRVEFLDDRIYAVPSAHPALDWTPLGGYPYLGYLVRFGRQTIYHAGDCVPYDGLASRLRPYNVTAALLPINGGNNFDIVQAAQLAEEIGASWLVPMHYGTFRSADADIGRFIDHMLGRRPSQRFKIFECGECWEIPEE